MNSQQQHRDPIRDIFSNPILWTNGSSRDKMEAMSKLDSILYNTINTMVKREPGSLDNEHCNHHRPPHPSMIRGSQFFMNSHESTMDHFKLPLNSCVLPDSNSLQVDSVHMPINDTAGASSSRRSLAFKKKPNINLPKEMSTDMDAMFDEYENITDSRPLELGPGDTGPNFVNHSQNKSTLIKNSGLENSDDLQMFTRFSGSSMFIELGKSQSVVHSKEVSALPEKESADIPQTTKLNLDVGENELTNEFSEENKTNDSENAITEEQNRLKPTKGTRKYFIKIIDGKKFHECSLCTKLFKTRAERKAHNRMHRETIMDVDVKVIDGKRWRECSECSKLFKTRKELRIHFRIHSNEKPYSCEVCGKAFKQIAHMNSHMKIHSGEKPHTCDLCGMNFSERSSLKRHVRRHLGIRPYQCEVCEKTFYTSTTLKSHKESHEIRSGTKARYDCTICKKSYSRKETLNKHMKTHDPEQRITCEQCGCYFLTKAHLKRHQLTHKVSEDKNEDYKKFFCGVCEKKFSTDGLLKSHMVTHKKERNFKCEICSCTFKDKYALQRHGFVHNPVDREKKATHLCEQCGKKFLSASSLRYHLASHMENKPFACEVCNRAFSRERDMIKHATIHEKDTHFKCPECDETFQLRKQLLLHISRRHPEEEKIHQCKICLKIFSRDDTLKCHMKRHEGTAYPCDICEKIFDRKSNLKVHKLTHTMTSDIQCPYCPMKVRYKRSLVRHIARRHKNVGRKDPDESLSHDSFSKDSLVYGSSMADEEEKNSLNQYYDDANSSMSYEVENLSNDEDSNFVPQYEYTINDDKDDDDNDDEDENYDENENDTSYTSNPDQELRFDQSKTDLEDGEISGSVENPLILKNTRVSSMSEIDKNVIDIQLNDGRQTPKNASTSYKEEQNRSSTDDYTDYEDYHSVP